EQQGAERGEEDPPRHPGPQVGASALVEDAHGLHSPARSARPSRSYHHGHQARTRSPSVRSLRGVKTCTDLPWTSNCNCLALVPQAPFLLDPTAVSSECL